MSVAAEPAAAAPAQRSAWRLILRSPTFLVGAVILLWWIFCALFGAAIVPYDPYADDLMNSLLPPSAEHWFGTDQLGRDMFSRVLVGARDILTVAPLATVLSTVVGTALGLVMGYFRGLVDETVSRVVDALLALPTVIVALLALVALGPSTATVIFVIGFTFAPIIARTVRASVLAERELDYVAAARLRRESAFHIMFVEILPNVLGPVGRRLAVLSPIRSIASVRQVSAAVLKKPFSATGPAVGWVAETAARPQTDSSTLAELQFPTMELYAMPAATASLLEDSVVDLDQWISAEVEAAFAEQEGGAFVSGDGTAKPRGFLDYTQAAESAWTWGKIGYTLTGVSGDWPEDDPSDVLIDTVYALKAGYRQNANWIMNRKTQAAIRKLKDADGNYLWQPPSAPGQRAMLMGFPLVEAEDMPDIGANATPVAFGDFGRGYLVVDRAGLRVLRDPYSAKPYVLFYTTKRVGGGVQDFDAIKLLKFGTA